MQTFEAFIKEAKFSVDASRNTRLPQRSAPVQTAPVPSPAQAIAQPPVSSMQVPPAVTQQNIPTSNMVPATQVQPATAPAQPATPTISKAAPGQNGRLVASQLAQVEPGHLLTPTAANNFQQMKAAAAKDGVALNINNAYRSYEDQVKMANQYGLYSKGGKAAVPGTSNHGLGKAVDLNVKSNPGSFEWLKNNAAKYGFYNIPREPWHWEVRTA
jgi:LAS superfamily LD-carboxypeptidase LdcB